jgi:uncharacterized protein (DUF1330 family)
MPADPIVELAIHHATAYEPDKVAVPALAARHGGEYLVRGGAWEPIEGGWNPERIVVFRFPSREAIRAFQDDPDCAPLRGRRQRAASSRAIAVEGIA